MGWIKTFGTPPVHWLTEPTLRDGRGPERVATEDPPDDWKPAPFVGFTTPTVEREPLTWEGDDA